MPIVLAIGIVLFIKLMAELSVCANKPRASVKEAPISDYIPDEFVIYDTETTGLDSLADDIIEIGAIKVNKLADTTLTYQSLIKIDRKIPKKATEIHGITDEMLDKDGIPLEVALKEFKEFIGNLPTIAFNSDFDKRFINNAAKKVGMKNIIKHTTCALKLARRAWPNIDNHKLGTVASMLGIDTNGLHRSLADCKATLCVYMYAVPIVKDRYRGR